MATVSKTLSWQSVGGSVDHYEVAIATTATGTKIIIHTTTDTNTTATIEYDSSDYPTAWLFVRAVDDSGGTGDWSDPISATSLTPTFTPPEQAQYAYSNDVQDILAGVTLPAGVTTFRLNKACLDASREIDTLTNRRFTPQTLVEKYDGTGTSELTVDHYPITNLNYVQVSDGSGLTIIRTYSSSDLELSDYESGILILKPVTVDNLDTSWQTAATLLYGHIFSPGVKNIEISYQHGHLFYVEGETLQLSSTTTSSGTILRTYQAVHHNWSVNNISIYQNGTLLTSGYTVNTTQGTVAVADGEETDTITAYYYHTVPHVIESACAKMTAIWALQQQIAESSGGTASFKNMNYQEVYGTKPHGQLIEKLQNDIDKLLVKYQDYEIYTS